MVILNNPLPLGVRYWYMKQSVEMGWSSNVLKMQIESNLYDRQIKSNKVNNFTATLPAPQSDLANYLLKDPYIFDLAGAKEKADERDIEEQLVKHVTRYLLEMGNGFALRLSTSERTRSLMEPVLLTSSIFNKVRFLLYCFSKVRISSIRKASGPHPKEVSCIYCT